WWRWGELPPLERQDVDRTGASCVSRGPVRGKRHGVCVPPPCFANTGVSRRILQPPDRCPPPATPRVPLSLFPSSGLVLAGNEYTQARSCRCTVLPHSQSSISGRNSLGLCAVLAAQCRPGRPISPPPMPPPLPLLPSVASPP